MDDLPAGFVIRGQQPQAFDALPDGFVVRGENSQPPFIAKASNTINSASADALHSFINSVQRGDNPLSSGLQGEGKIGGGITGLMGDVAGSIGGKNAIDAANEAKSYIANSMIGRGISNISNSANNSAPELTQDIGAAMNLATVPAAGNAIYQAGKLGVNGLEAMGREFAPIQVPLSKTIPNIAKGFNASDIDELNAAKQAGHDIVAQAYQAPSLLSTILTPEAEQGLKNQLLSAVDNTTINPAASPKTLGAVKELYNRITVGKTNPITGTITQAPLSISEIDGYRRLLSKAASGEDSAAAGKIRNGIDDFLNNVDQTHLANGTPQAIADLNNARATASSNFKYQDVADGLIKANGNPARIQTFLTKFISNPDNLQGLSDTSVSALKEAANGTTAQAIMKGIGKFGFDSNNAVGPLVSTAVSIPAAGFGAAAIPAIGTAARYGNKLAVRGAAENALKSMTPSQVMQLTPAQAIQLGIRP